MSASNCAPAESTAVTSLRPTTTCPRGARYRKHRQRERRASIQGRQSWPERTQRSPSRERKYENRSTDIPPPSDNKHVEDQGTTADGAGARPVCRPLGRILSTNNKGIINVPAAPLLPFSVAYGIVHGMELRIDKAGRIVVPKPLRERLGFKPDTELEAIEQPEGVLLKRVEQRPSMVKVDGLWVHRGRAEPGANWERVLEDVREERIESVLKA